MPVMQRDAGFAAVGAAVGAGPITQMRATASEQYAMEPTELGAASEPMLTQDPTAMARAEAPQRIEPTLAPQAEPIAPAPHQHAAPGAATHGLASNGSASPGAPSPTAPPRGGRAPASTLFAPAEPKAAVSQPPAPHASGVELQSRSLFGRVTGRFGFRHAAEPEAPPPTATQEPQPVAEPVRPTVRQTTAEDIGIGIPNFLLRQTSGTATSPRR